jgi:hypothetical protein
MEMNRCHGHKYAVLEIALAVVAGLACTIKAPAPSSASSDAAAASFNNGTWPRRGGAGNDQVAVDEAV